MTKAEWRRMMRQRLREAASSGQLTEWNHLLATHLQLWVANLPHRATVALFGGLPDEPDLWTTLAPTLRRHGHTPALFLTHSASHTMQLFAPREPNHTLRAPLGYWQPDPNPGTLPLQPDIVLIPGLAFDSADGSRLGRGAGYYDRYLATLGSNVARIGIGYHCQLVTPLPTEPHDLPVQSVCTEAGWLQLDTR